MKHGKCKGCGASILWISTLGGKAMPCDDTPVYYKENAHGKERVVTPNGETITCYTVDNPRKADGVGYVPHWGTCPAADRFKKRERR